MTITTLNNYISNGYALPSILDEATQKLVTDWFGTRYIVKDHFDTYMERQCIQDYPRYQQLLRLDPISAEYDWFVEFYREHKSTTTGTGSDILTGKTTTSGTTGSTTNTTQTTTGSGTDELTHNTTVDGTNSSTGKIENTGTNSNTHADKNVTQNADAHDAVSRVAPMSAEYTATAEDGVQTIDGGDIGNVSTVVYGGMVAPAILNPSASEQSRNKSNAGTVGNSTDSGTNSNTQDTSNSGTDQKKTTGTETTTHSTNNNVTTGVTGSGTNSEEAETNNTTTRTNSDTVKSQDTGRTMSIAAVLNEATAAIRNTSAWVWFRDELDKCFIQSYIISDDDNDMSIEVE